MVVAEGVSLILAFRRVPAAELENTNPYTLVIYLATCGVMGVVVMLSLVLIMYFLLVSLFSS